MPKISAPRISFLLVLGVVGLVMSHQVYAGNTAATSTPARSVASSLERTLEPIIVKGARLAAFLGSPVDHLFVYVYRAGAWTQVPAQVDEVTSAGEYVTTEDGLWDANDELVFMAQDLGDQAVDVTPVADGAPIDGPWYEVEVTNPLSPSQKAWAYVVRSSTLSRTFTADYVSIDPFLERISADNYHLGFARLRQWMDYLTLNESTVDILDRTKIRLYCGIPVVCPISEIWFPSSGGLIKDGPVRVITRGGEVLAYGTMFTWTTSISIPISIQLPSDLSLSLGLSTDFNEAVSGATFYNSAIPDGVTADGVPDTVPPSPLSLWWQLSTGMGTVIQVSDTSALGGTQTNYYVDDATTFDSSDTGDGKRYADAGVYIADPNLFSAYSFVYYFLPDVQPNVGATYYAYFEHPLLVTTIFHAGPGWEKVYLPVILNNAIASSTSPPQIAGPGSGHKPLAEEVLRWVDWRRVRSRE
jgi:hypothetical protein